jgi:hypothetical protein
VFWFAFYMHCMISNPEACLFHRGVDRPYVSAACTKQSCAATAKGK